MYPAFIVMIVNGQRSMADSLRFSTAARSRGNIEGHLSAEGRLETLAFAITSAVNTDVSAIERPQEPKESYGPLESEDQNLGVA